MIACKSFGFPREENLFEKVIQILKNEYGLVEGAIHPKEGNIRCLVWEDKKGIGRWRVHCFGNQEWEEITKDKKLYDIFRFGYWTTKAKFDKETLLKDPMKEPLEKILSLSTNRFDNKYFNINYTIEELEKAVFEAE
jgi:hypothetical protein